MKRQDFHYQLPDELIARRPMPERSASRLLSLDGESGALQHGQFTDLLNWLSPGDLLVFNNTKVIPARLFGAKETGGKVEVLVERVLDNRRVLAHTKASKSPKEDSVILLEDGTQLKVLGRQEALFELELVGEGGILEALEKLGHMPLPPYIDRPDDEVDRDRYQTVYGEKPGAVAAPTAGLHFDDRLLKALEDKGVNMAFVTLHVGAGTFQPVRADNITDHQMHSEVMELDEAVCELVKKTKAAGNKVIAVGTTSVRCLETASQDGEIRPYQGETNIFIYPSYQYKTVDALITNFHLPESTLLMLVSAFAGYRNTMAAYDEAVAERYRFFSYGDAMFITRNPNADIEEVARLEDRI